MSRSTERNTHTSIPGDEERNRICRFVSDEKDSDGSQSEAGKKPAGSTVAKTAGDLEITIISPSPRFVSEEEAIFWLQLMPPHVIALIYALDDEETTAASSCKEESEQLQYYQCGTQKGGAA